MFGYVRICSVQAGCPFLLMQLNRFLNGPFQLLSQAVTTYSSAPINHLGDFGGLSNEFPTDWFSFTSLFICGCLPRFSTLLESDVFASTNSYPLLGLAFSF